MDAYNEKNWITQGSATLARRGTSMLPEISRRRATVQGKVTEISQTTFTVTERQSGKPMTFACADALQVKQSGMSKGAKIGIGIGIAVAALIVVLVLVTKPWQSE